MAYDKEKRGLDTEQTGAAHADREMGGSRRSAQTLKVVMHSDVKIIDPFWTTAYIVRNYGYMVYDTLLAVDDKLQIKPQMLEGWKAGR